MKALATLTLATSIALAALAAPVHATEEDAVASALDWLRTQQAPNGSIGGATGSAWAALAFRAGGVDPATVRTAAEAPSLVDNLKAEAAAGHAFATTWEILLLGAVASEGPGAAADFGGVDVLAQLLTFFDGTQFGDPNLLNDDIFALFALDAAGVARDAPVVLATRDWLLAHQQANGGFSWGVFGAQDVFSAFTLGGDTEMTAATIAALDRTATPANALATSVAVARGTEFVKHLQTLDGGCASSYFDVVFSAAFGGLGGNADSTGWAMAGLAELGEDLDGSEWTTPTGGTMGAFLLSLQQDDGSFLWKAGSPSFQPVTTTSTAVLALTGSTFVVTP